MENFLTVRYDDKSERQTVSARDLWEFLDKPYTEFMKWFNKYKDYGFVENEDFRELRIKIRTSNGAEHDAVDYEITVDMAKELSMLQRSDKGKLARQYFIELEKQWNSPEAIMARAVKMANVKMLELQSHVIQLETKIESDKPKVEFADTISDIDDGIEIGEYAKSLYDNSGINVGRNRLFQWFRNKGYLMDDNMPYQQSMKYFKVKEYTYNKHGVYRFAFKTYVNGKGQLYFFNKIKDFFGVVKN